MPNCISLMKYMLSGFEMKVGFITTKSRNLVLYVDLSCNKTVENMIFILMISNLATFKQNIGRLRFHPTHIMTFIRVRVGHQENMSMQYIPHFYLEKLGHAGVYLFLAHLSRRLTR